MLSKLVAAAGALALTCASATAEDAKPNDAQIAHIAYTAGQIDIQAAELALRKSKNKDVRDFAENMVRDHKAVNENCLGTKPSHAARSRGIPPYRAQGLLAIDHIVASSPKRCQPAIVSA